MKKILAINFSQTGQLDDIINKFLEPFCNEDIDRINIQSEKPFPFPWTPEEFFDIMPETVLESPILINPINFKYEKYDLIILGHQPWFLSPSMPTTALFQNQKFCEILNKTPIITIIGARNMWISAQERIKQLIDNAGGELVGNIPFIDKTPNLISVITISHWMFSGKKEKKWNILPYPGVSKNDINEACLFGKIVMNAMQKSSYKNLQQNILNSNKIRINTNILFVELRAKTIFTIWAKKINQYKKKSTKRIMILKLFKCYLYFALFFISPILLTFYMIFIVPFNLNRIKEKKNYFSSIDLK